VGQLERSACVLGPEALSVIELESAGLQQDDSGWPWNCPPKPKAGLSGPPAPEAQIAVANAETKKKIEEANRQTRDSE